MSCLAVQCLRVPTHTHAPMSHRMMISGSNMFAISRMQEVVHKIVDKDFVIESTTVLGDTIVREIRFDGYNCDLHTLEFQETARENAVAIHFY